MGLPQPATDLDNYALKAKPGGAPAVCRLQGITAAFLPTAIALAVIHICAVYADVDDVWPTVVALLLSLLSALVTLHLFWSMCRCEALSLVRGVAYASETLKFPILVLGTIFSCMILPISLAPFYFDTSSVFTAMAAATATTAAAAIPILFLLFPLLLLLLLRCVVKGSDGLHEGQMPSSIIQRESLRHAWRPLLMILGFILSCTMHQSTLTAALASPFDIAIFMVGATFTVISVFLALSSNAATASEPTTPGKAPASAGLPPEAAAVDNV